MATNNNNIDERVEKTFKELLESLDLETAARYTYVPSVVAQLAWDYADTVVLIAREKRIESAKAASRNIVALRKSMDGIRLRALSQSNREGEDENMYCFEEGVVWLFNDMAKEVRELMGDSHDVEYVVALLQAQITVDAVIQYNRMQAEKVSKLINRRALNMTAPQLYRLQRQLECYPSKTSHFWPIRNKYYPALVKLIWETKLYHTA